MFTEEGREKKVLSKFKGQGYQITNNEMYGMKNGYNFRASIFQKEKYDPEYIFILSCYIKLDNKPDEKLEDIKKELSTLGECVLDKAANLAIVKWRSELDADDEYNVLSFNINKVISILKGKDCTVCDINGEEGNVKLYNNNGKFMFLSEESALNKRNELKRDKNMEDEIQENYIAGIFGAIIGGFISCLVIFLLVYFLHVVTFLSFLVGIVVAVAYHYKAQRFSIIGAIVSIVVSIVMCYYNFRIIMALRIAKAVHMDFLSVFKITKEIFKMVGAMSDYYHEMFLIAGLPIFGSIVTIIYYLKNEKTKFNLDEVK